MLTFHACIRGAGPGASEPLSVTFDQALDALQSLQRLFIEPDGSFVWAGTLSDGRSWQVDGNLIDRGDLLAYVDLKGRCTDTQLEQILTVLGWPEQPLAFELTRSGRLVDEMEFRQLAATQAGAI